MLIFSVIVIALLSYLTVGTFVARRDYANRLAEANRRNPEELLEAKRAKIREIKHTLSCWRGDTYRSTYRDCDCRHAFEWKALDREIRALEAGQIEVAGPYRMLFAWPVVGFDGFLRGGKPTGQSPLLPKSWEEKMEQELLRLDP